MRLVRLGVLDYYYNFIIIIIIVVVINMIYQERHPKRILDGAHLEDKEREDLEIRGCRRLQRK